MLTERDKSLLQHIIKHCLKIETKIEGITLDIFITNEDLREIICFNLIQIGELAKNVSQELITKYSDMPWSQIKGLRDRIAHGYGSIDTLEFGILPVMMWHR